MDMEKQDMIDRIDSHLRKAYAISDLMACSDNMTLKEGTVQELGIQLMDQVKLAMTDLEMLGQYL